MGIGKIIKAQDFSQNFAPISHNQDAATINTGIFSINRIPALPYLSSTGKAADSELLDGLNSTAFSLVNHNHDWSSLNTVSIPAFASRWPDWSEVTNKPTTFIPSSHDHDAASITSGVFDSARIPVLPYLSSTGKAADSELLDGLDSTAFVLATDSRLVNSREWISSTVSQAEAEAGTGTFRRAFTPQRVFQANASYINQFGVKTVAGRIGDIVLSKADVGLSNVQNIDATDASNIVTGTLNVSRLSTNVALRSSTQTFSGINTFTEKVNFTNPTLSIEASGPVLANSFTGNGAGLTNLSAANLTGTIADARLSSNVALENVGNRFTSTQTIATNQYAGLTLESTGAGTNLKRWLITTGSTSDNTLAVQTRNDDGTFLGTWLTIGRTGNVTMPGTVTSTVFRTVDDSLNRFEQNRLILRGGSPTVYLRTTGGRSAMIHNNGQKFYLLSGVTDSEVWTVAPGRTSWPVVIDLNTNAVTLDGSVETISTVNATSRTSAASIKTAGGIACAGDIYANKVSFTQSDIVSFTPFYEGTGWGYGYRYGVYTRIGRTIHFVIIIGITAVGTAPNSIIRIGSLPLPIQTTFFGGFRPNDMQNLPSGYQWQPYLGVDGWLGLEYGLGSNASVNGVTPSMYTPSTGVHIAGYYITAS